MTNHKYLIGLVTLAIASTTSVGCGKKSKGAGTQAPGSSSVQPSDPSTASAAAKEAFAQATKHYEDARAKGSLSEAECETLSKRFLGVYKDYKAQMAVAKFNAGAIWEQCGHTDKAQKIYEELVVEVPKYDLSYNNLGVIYWNNKQEARALEYFGKAVEANPATRAPRNNLAAALRNKYADQPDQTEFDKAERELQTVLAVDSGNRYAYENLARLYYDRGHLKDKSYLLLADLVVGQAIKVLEKDNQQSADLYNIKGLLFMEQDNKVEALKRFKKAVEIDKNHADAHMNIAMIAIWFRDYKTAEESINVAIKDPRQKRNVEAYLGLGVALRGQRKYADAEAAFNQALKVAPGDSRALFNLGVLYQDYIFPEVQAQGDGSFNQKPYDTAKDYFAKFAGKAGADKALAEAVADAKHRVEIIDEGIRNVAEMKKLEEENKKLEAEMKRQEEEEKARLRKMEEELLKQQQGGGEAAGQSPS